MPSSDFEEKGIKPAVFDGELNEEPELPPNLQAVAHKGFLGILRHYENLLDKKIGVEAHGPARILPENRDPAYGKWSNQKVMCVYLSLVFAASFALKMPRPFLARERLTYTKGAHVGQWYDELELFHYRILGMGVGIVSFSSHLDHNCC